MVVIESEGVMVIIVIKMTGLNGVLSPKNQHVLIGCYHSYIVHLWF